MPQYVWADVIDYVSFRPVWERISSSVVWKTDIEPWFRQSLLKTLFALAQERDEEKVMRLQERAKLINEWLETPKIAEARFNAHLDNLAMTGSDEDFKKGLEGANRYAGR